MDGEVLHSEAKWEALYEQYRELLVEHRSVQRQLKLLNSYVLVLAQRLVEFEQRA